MSTKLTTINKINTLAKDGLTAREIASELSLAVKTVRRVLREETGSEQRRIADRAEYFFQGICDSGCYETRMLDDSTLITNNTLGEYSDPTFETVAFEEELGIILEEIEEITKNL